MKIAIVVPTQFSGDSVIGGAERYAFELARALSSLAHTELITFGAKDESFVRNGLKVTVHKTLWNIRGKRSNPFSLKFAWQLRNFDVVHCQQYNTFVSNWAWLTVGRKKKFFLTDLAGGGFNFNRWFNLVRLADASPSISEFSARFMQRKFGLTPDLTPVTYAGVDTEKFRPRELIRQNRVLFVGRILPHKGIHVLIDALPKKVQLEIIGRPYDPEYLSRLKSAARSKDVIFTEDASDEEIVRAYCTARAFVLPSIPISERPELFGLVAAEAMACGTPVIASDAGSLPEVVKDGETGFVVPAGAIHELGNAIERLCADQGMAEEMGAAGRVRVLKRFTWQRVAERHIEIYERF